MAIIRTRLILPVGNWTTRLRMSRNGAASSSRSASAAERDNLVRFMEIERFHSLHDDLALRFRVGNGEKADVSLRWNRAPDQVHVAHLFQKRIADDEG